MKATQSEINRALYGPRSKYSAKRTNGYASKKEANIMAALYACEKGGAIFDVKEQVRYELVPAQKGSKRNEKSLVYVADATYRDKLGTFHVVDAKGARTALYIVKRKLMKFVHNIEIEEL